MIVLFMTKLHLQYTYVATMPLLVVFSVAMSILKYREGMVYMDISVFSLIYSSRILGNS